MITLFPNQRGGILRDNNWHTANSLLAELGIDAEQGAAICGHSQAVDKAVYTKVSLEVKRAAMDKLAALFPNPRELCHLSGMGREKGTYDAAEVA